MANRQVSHKEYWQLIIEQKESRQKLRPALKSRNYQERKRAEQELNNIALKILRARPPG